MSNFEEMLAKQIAKLSPNQPPPRHTSQGNNLTLDDLHDLTTPPTQAQTYTTFRPDQAARRYAAMPATSSSTTTLLNLRY
ncbi:hypothetical protein HOC01_03490 [archaeon]|jgi:hypothetical protein|nr:hypothetical protein [archaeon]MBT6698525.1 hypothetical protein [archaeon]